MNSLGNGTSPNAMAVPVALLQAIQYVTWAFYLLSSYVIPFFFLFGNANNALCLLVFFRDRGFYEHTNKNARLYYIVLACCDIGILWYWLVFYFIGDGLSWITNGAVYMYNIS